jgi:hypothetical protein
VHIALLCPFTAGTSIWQAQDGAATLTVCVRGTFSLVHGREAVLADAQEPVTGDRYYERGGGIRGPSLYAASELVPYKPRADVILVGSAFAPEQTPVDALIARISIEELDKSVGVIGDRRWSTGPDGLEPSAPEPFRIMPLRYERAARAPDNPVGVDLARAPTLGELALPNLEAVDDAPDTGQTLGFGPVPIAAATRRGLLHPEALAWATEGGKGPVPKGFDFAFYNAAPRDQQIDLLRHSASIVLENLHREHARFVAKLPHVRPRTFLVSRDGERSLEVALRCDTLWIDTDRAVMSLSWRGLVGLGADEAEGLETLVVAAESKGKELRYKHIQRMLRDGASVSLDEDHTGDTHPLAVRHDRVRTSPGSSITPSAASSRRPPEPDSHSHSQPEPAPSRDDTTGESEAKTLERRLPPGLAAELAARYTAEPPAAGAALIWDELSSSELLDAESTTTNGPREAAPPSGDASRDGALSERTRPLGRKR